MKHLGSLLHRQLLDPIRIFFVCLGFALVSLLFNGGLMNLYSLYHEKTKLTEQRREILAQTLDLEQKLKLAKDPSYLERQALDRFELVEAHDLVFAFADE